MCGITVFFGDHTVANLDLYFKRGSKRGPEEYIYECNQDVHLGFHRLAINGLNKESSQPLHFKHYVLVCNGEIYNYKELVKKYNFKMETHSDCEVILKLYDLLKEKCVYELDGEFSFVIHDLSNDHVFVARDSYGVRPLYINQETNAFCLSSDLSPMSIFPMDNVSHFPPGHYATFIKNHTYEQHLTCFHSIQKVPTSFEKVYLTLCKAVEKRVLNSERPIACLLSGGLDSSLVAALAARYCRQHGTILETFSIGLPGSEDLKFSSKVAEHIGSKHTQIICSEDEFFDSIPNVIRDIESYDTTSVRASVGNWNVGKYIKENSEAKVILNGDGADELMGGYLYFSACPDKEEFDKECRRLLQDIHCFDVLRSDKSIASHGLEPRTPYLDKDFVDAYMSMPIDVRFHKDKYLMRNIINAFDPHLIPSEILYRKKEAFSDGVSGLDRSWYQMIQEKIPIMEKIEYSHNPPTTDEQRYYRALFKKYHANCDKLIPYFWMPRYVSATDASARTLSQYKVADSLDE
jgi:asparagine synthase (glutamine-hydrolysing)